MSVIENLRRYFDVNGVHIVHKDLNTGRWCANWCSHSPGPLEVTGFDLVERIKICDARIEEWQLARSNMELILNGVDPNSLKGDRK